jgi:hypothetical protein
MSDVSSAGFEEITASNRVAQYTTPPTLIVPVREDLGTYVPLLGACGDASPTFVWTNATHRISTTHETFADLIVEDGDSPLVVLNVSTAGGTATRSVQVSSCTLTPDLTVPGLQGQTLFIDFTGLSFNDLAEVLSVTFGGSGITTVSTEVVSSSRLKVVINVAANATPGLRTATVTRTVGAFDIENVLTVYGGQYRGTVDNLITLIDRPAFGTPAPVLIGSAFGTGPRTSAQETRLAAVFNATTRQQVLTAWNTWIRNDGTLTIRPSTITPQQMDILIDAAIAFEVANPTMPTPHQGANPPSIPLSMWRGLLQFIVPLESGYQTTGCVLTMAGVAAENSYGLCQFHDSRASGSVFSGTQRKSVPIYNPGILTDWKARVMALTTLAGLRTELTTLGATNGTGDWRADPYYSLINFIRSSNAHYIHLISGVRDQFPYAANDSFRVDLVPPARANGSGSQRDCFEFFGVVHRLPGDAFGDTPTYQGGVLYSPTPNQWQTSGGSPLYMTPEGTTRAGEGRTYYDTNAPAGGYQ